MCKFNFRVSTHTNIKPALKQLQDTISQIASDKESDLCEIISHMDFAALNKTLYRCDQEERDETQNKFGVYHVPGNESLVYAGLQGVLKYYEYTMKCIFSTEIFHILLLIINTI